MDSAFYAPMGKDDWEVIEDAVIVGEWGTVYHNSENTSCMHVVEYKEAMAARNAAITGWYLEPEPEPITTTHPVTHEQVLFIAALATVALALAIISIFKSYSKKWKD